MNICVIGAFCNIGDWCDMSYMIAELLYGIIVGIIQNLVNCNSTCSVQLILFVL